MIKLKSLLNEFCISPNSIPTTIREIEESNLMRWVGSMVNTVKDHMLDGRQPYIDVGEAYDIIKTDFRADSPSIEEFEKACKKALDILTKEGKIK